jgi:hypothetical protein
LNVSEIIWCYSEVDSVRDHQAGITYIHGQPKLVVAGLELILVYTWSLVLVDRRELAEFLAADDGAVAAEVIPGPRTFVF